VEVTVLRSLEKGLPCISDLAMVLKPNGWAYVVGGLSDGENFLGSGNMRNVAGFIQLYKLQ
jgi:hypothetical protein